MLDTHGVYNWLKYYQMQYLSLLKVNYVCQVNIYWNAVCKVKIKNVTMHLLIIFMQQFNILENRESLQLNVYKINYLANQENSALDNVTMDILLNIYLKLQ